MDVDAEQLTTISESAFRHLGDQVQDGTLLRNGENSKQRLLGSQRAALTDGQERLDYATFGSEKTQPFLHVAFDDRLGLALAQLAAATAFPSATSRSHGRRPQKRLGSAGSCFTTCGALRSRA